jgi:hypothetical protein
MQLPTIGVNHLSETANEFKGRRVLPDLTEPQRNADPRRQAFLDSGGTVSQWLALVESAAKRPPARHREISATKRSGGMAPRHLIQHNSHFS